MLVGFGLAVIGLGIILSDTNNDLHTAGVILLIAGCVIIVLGVTWFAVKKSYDHIRPSLVRRLRDHTWTIENKHEQFDSASDVTPKIVTSSFIDAENVINETLTKEYMAEMEKRANMARHSSRRKRDGDSSKRRTGAGNRLTSPEAMMRVSTVSDPNFQRNWQETDTDFEY